MPGALDYTRSYFRDNEAATGASWVGTQNTKPDIDFEYARVLTGFPIAPMPQYSDSFYQEKYTMEPFNTWPVRPADGHRSFGWHFAPVGADQITQNAAVMAFVVGSRTVAVGAARSMSTPSVGYPNPECLFGELPVDLENDFKIGAGSNDHSFPWNYWSAKTWSMHQHLIGVMP